jgi:hypothetical protein
MRISDGIFTVVTLDMAIICLEEFLSKFKVFTMEQPKRAPEVAYLNQSCEADAPRLW